MLGLHCCAQAFSSCGEQGLLPVHMAHVGSVLGVDRLSCPDMWDLPRPGIEPVSPKVETQSLNPWATRKVLTFYKNICFLLKEHLGCFQFIAVTSKVSRSLNKHPCTRGHVFLWSRKSGIAQPEGVYNFNLVDMPNFPPKRLLSVYNSMFLHSCQHLITSVSKPVFHN